MSSRAGSLAGGADGADDREGAGGSHWDRRLLRRIASYFRPYWARGLLIFALMAVGAGTALVPALVTKTLLDYLSGQHAGFDRVALVLVGGVVAAIAGGVAIFAQAALETGISQGIMFELRRQLFDRLLGQSVGFFTENRTGEVMSRIVGDVREIEDVVEDTLSGTVSNVVILPATVAFMLVLDWRLTLLVPLLVLPWVIGSSRGIARKTHEATTQSQRQLGRITSYLQEVLGISGMLLVKAFVRQGAERARFHTLNAELRRLELRKARLQRWFDLLMDVLQAVAPALFWLVGGWLVLTGRSTVGTVVAFVLVLMGRLAMSAEDLGKLYVNLSGLLALFRRLFEVLDLPVEVTDAPHAKPLQGCRGAVEFDHVTFGYDEAKPPAVADVSFRAEPGRLVALVGPTGAGKSTVTYLLTRFYDPRHGRVLVDGHDVRDLTVESLQANVGIVFQDTFLFHATVRENLRYARPDATGDELEAAARAANLHDFIAGLPDGYDTVVGERGHRFSGGEKQRLAIARVLLKDPRILILDEATAHLDTVSEHLIQTALARLCAGRTALVIAHRLSTILTADLILVLDGGRVVERGTHAELLAAGGLYATLHARQFADGGPGDSDDEPPAFDWFQQDQPRRARHRREDARGDRSNGNGGRGGNLGNYGLGGRPGWGTPSGYSAPTFGAGSGYGVRPR